MAVFPDDETAWGRLDYRALRDSAAVLYYSETMLEEDLAWFRGEGYVIHDLDCRDWRAPEDFYRAAPAQLGFPDHFGRNLDAFNDCMHDVPVPSDGGMAIVFRGVDAFLRAEHDFFRQVLDVLAGATRQNLLHGRRLIVLAQSSDPRLAIEPVGALPVIWDPKEWLDAKRAPGGGRR